MKLMTPKKTIDGIKTVLYDLNVLLEQEIDNIRKKELQRQISSLQSAIYLIATIENKGEI